MIKKPGYGTTWHRHRPLRTRAAVLPIVLTCLAAGLPWRMPVAVAENAGFVKTVGARFMLDGAPHYTNGEAGLPGTRFYRIQVRPPW